MIAGEELTKTERQLIDATMVGEAVTCTDDGRHVRAEVIRDLLVGRRGEPDPRGLRLLDAEITGQLDVDGLFLDDGLVAEGRGPQAAVGMFDAQVGGRLDLGDAWLSTPRVPLWWQTGLVVTGDVFMRGTSPPTAPARSR